MTDQNLITSQDLAAASINFVDQFTDGINGLMQALQGVRLVPMANGSSIQTYKKTETEAASKTVGEGEEIPLSKVTRTKDKTYTLTLNDKLRKMTSFEAIQAVGFDRAVTDTDAKLLAMARKDAKSDLFNALDSKATTKITAGNFQQAVSKALGKLTGIFEDLDGAGQTVVFVNPDDFYGWLGNQQITTQSNFGLTYIKNFLNAGTIILSAGVKAGTVYATVNNNLNLYYVNMNGQAGQAFGMTTDASGLIGVKHSTVDQNLGYQTVVAGGWLFLPENTDGIVAATIQPASDTSSHA